MFNSKKDDLIKKLTFEKLSLNMRLEKQKEFMTKFISFFNSIMSSVDNSLVTSKHITRVAEMIKASLLIFPKDFILQNIKEDNYTFEIFSNSLYLGAYLHDLGKFYIPSSILSKPDKLTEKEFEVIKKHPVLGSIDLVNLPVDDIEYSIVIINNIILHHHSNMDGSGYPDKLKGNEIPFEARYVAVFDRLEALISKRSYKESMSLENAISILKNKNEVDKSILQLVEDNIDKFKKFE